MQILRTYQFIVKIYNLKSEKGRANKEAKQFKSNDGVAKSQARLSNFTFTFHFHALEEEMATHSSVLAWRIPGMGELVGGHLWGCTESDTTEVT